MLGMIVRNRHKHHVHDTTNCGFRPPRTSRMQATNHIPGLDNQPSSAVGATVLQGLRDSQSELSWQCTSRPSRRPPHRGRRPADGLVIGIRQKGTQHHIERWESTFFLGAAPMGQHNASEVRPAIGCWYTSLLSVLSCPPWEGNVVRCVLTDDTKLAVQHRPRREDERRVDEGIGHQNDELLRHKPAHVAHRQPEAVPEKPEEQRIDVLQVVSEPNLRWSNACLNFHHLDSQSAGYLERVRATTTVHPPLFEISITLTFRARYLKRVIDTATVYSRWFWFLTTSGHMATLIVSWWTFTHACLRFHHFDILSTAQTQTCSRFLQTFAFLIK